jgi:hypothetical protein
MREKGVGVLHGVPMMYSLFFYTPTVAKVPPTMFAAISIGGGDLMRGRPMV